MSRLSNELAVFLDSAGELEKVLEDVEPTRAQLVSVRRAAIRARLLSMRLESIGRRAFLLDSSIALPVAAPALEEARREWAALGLES